MAVLGIVGVAALFIVPRYLSLTSRPPIAQNNTSKVPCLVRNLPLLQHIHPHLEIFVNGKQESIPTDIGIGACELAIHTHDTTGELHVEAQDKRDYTLGDFFGAWGKPFQRDGYALEMKVDNANSTEYENLIFKDKQHIVITYVSIPAESGTTCNSTGKQPNATSDSR